MMLAVLLPKVMSPATLDLDMLFSLNSNNLWVSNLIASTVLLSFTSPSSKLHM